MFKDSISSQLIAINLIILLVYSLPATIFSQELGLDQLYDNTTWQQIDSPNGGRTSYIASNSSKIVLVTPNGFVYVIDKNTNNIIQRFLSDDLNGVENAFINENDEVFVNIGKASFKSIDFGASFSKIADYSIKEIDDKNYYSFANSDLLSSDDGGKSWRTLINNYGPESIKAKGDTLISSGGRYRSSPSIYLSTNKGLSFENITADLNQDSRIIDVDLLNGKPLALSSEGLISYYTDSSWVSIGTLESDYPTDLIVFHDNVFALGQNLLVGFKFENNSFNEVYSKDNFVTYTSNLSVNKSELILKTFTNTFLIDLNLNEKKMSLNFKGYRYADLDIVGADTIVLVTYPSNAIFLKNENSQVYKNIYSRNEFGSHKYIGSTSINAEEIIIATSNFIAIYNKSTGQFLKKAEISGDGKRFVKFVKYKSNYFILGLSDNQQSTKLTLLHIGWMNYQYLLDKICLLKTIAFM